MLKIAGKIIVGGMKHNRGPGFVRPFVNREVVWACGRADYSQARRDIERV